MAITKKSLADIKNGLVNSFVYEFSSLTGIPVQIYNGDLLDTIFSVTSNALYELYSEVYNVLNSITFTTAVGDELDRQAYVFGISRLPATNSQGVVTISLSSPYTSTYTISPGTIQLVDNTGNYYYNIDQIYLNTGTTFFSAFFVSAMTGASTNILPNTITTVRSLPGIDYNTYPVSITNGAFYGGSDSEDDNSFRARIQNTIDSLANGTVGYLTNFINTFQSQLYTTNGVPISVVSSKLIENFQAPYAIDYVFVGEEAYVNTSSIYYSGSTTYTSTIMFTTAVTNIPVVPIYNVTNAFFKLNYLDTSSNPIPIQIYNYNFNQQYSNYTSTNGIVYKPVQLWDVMINYATGDILANPDTSTCATFYANGSPVIPGIFPSGSQLILNLSYFTGIYNELQNAVNNTRVRVVGSNVLIQPAPIYKPSFIVLVAMETGFLFKDYITLIQSAIQSYFANNLSPGDSIYLSELTTAIYNSIGFNIIKDIQYTDLNNNPIYKFSNPTPGNYQLVYDPNLITIKEVAD